MNSRSNTFCSNRNTMQLYDEFSYCQDYSAIYTLAGSHINRFIPFGSLPMSIKSLHSSIWLTLRFCFCCCSTIIYFSLCFHSEKHSTRVLCARTILNCRIYENLMLHQRIQVLLLRFRFFFRIIFRLR